MGPFELGAIAVVGGLLYSAYGMWVKARGNINHEKLEELEQKIAALESHQDTKQLQERVQVLEEIVTSKEFELEQKLRQLDSQASKKEESSK